LSKDHWRHPILTDAWIPLDLVPQLDPILDTADSIIVITGHAELHEAMRSHAGARVAALITVPVQDFQPPSVEQAHLADAFLVARHRLSRDPRGERVLVSARLFGRVYCHPAQRHGAVAIDLGAFDLMAGLVSRPVHKQYDIAAMRWI
jgi:hypothetical protein